MGRAALMAAAALALIASGPGSEVGQFAAPRLRGIRYDGEPTGTAGGYRKRPAGSHKQKRRQQLAKRRRG